MLPLRFAHRWRVAGVILLAAAFGAALLPAFWSRIDTGTVIDFDKWLHGLAFTALAVWFSGQYARRAYGWLGAGLLLFGAVIEAAQYLTFHRTAEWRDLYADAAGIVLGLIIAGLGPGGWSLRFERWIEARQGSHG